MKNSEFEDESKQINKKHRVVKYVLAAIAILVCIGFITGVLYAVISYYVQQDVVITTSEALTTTMNPNEITTTMNPNKITAEDVYNFYPEANHDGINIVFHRAVNDKEKLNAALLDKRDGAIEGDVNLKYQGSLSPTDEPIMNNPPQQISELTFEQWLDAVIDSGKVIKIDMTVNEVVEIALNVLSQRSQKLRQPVWINAEVLSGPNTDTNPLNFSAFIEHVNSIFPYVTLSLGWKTRGTALEENEQYTWESMDNMLKLLQSVTQKTTILTRSTHVRSSWDKFLWLIEQSDKFTLTLYDDAFDQVPTDDMLFVRDNLDVSKVFYDNTNKTSTALKRALANPNRIKMFFSGGNVIDYFRICNREAIQVTWAHRVLTRDELNLTLNDENILMLETDIRLYGEGTNQVNNSLPVMAHDPPALNYDLTLEEWLAKVIASKKTKGIKLDFKSLGALEASLNILKKFGNSLNMPVWLNSDIFKGPNSATRPINATMFFQLIQENFPDVTLSPGWTTTYRRFEENEYYTDDMMREAYDACSHMRQAVTFPVRASLARPSVKQFQWLLSKSNRYTLTVWHSTSETVEINDLFEFYNSFPPSKVFFDIPDKMMEELQQLIKAQNTKTTVVN